MIVRKVKILFDDAAGRYKAGEEGITLQNDSIKYDYFIELPGSIKLPDFLGGGTGHRQFYFYKEEVQLS